MFCPQCGSGNVHPVSEVKSTTRIKGFSCCKGALGAIVFGSVGWVCGLFGMGKGKTVSKTDFLWICSACGKRFR